MVTVFLALGAFNSQNNLLFWSLGLAFGGLIVSGIVSGSALMGVEVRREAISPREVGEPMQVRYLIANSSRVMPVFALHVEECTERPRGTPAPTWPDHIPQVRALAMHVGPRERVVVTGEVVPHWRGEARLTSVRVWTTFPFGIARKSVTFFEDGTALVRPRQVPLRASLVETVRGRLEQGPHVESQAGLGEEFYGLREYRPGDSPRMVAWRPSARLGSLVVRTNMAPSPRKLWVVLRLPMERESEEIDERAICVAASLLTLGSRLGNAVGLSVPLAGVLQAPRADGRSMERMLNELGRLDLDVVRAAPRADRFPAAASHAGGCIVVHAGALDPTWGSRRARHVSVRAMESLIADRAGAEPIEAAPAGVPA